jgi:hypothetical protein
VCSCGFSQFFVWVDTALLKSPVVNAEPRYLVDARHLFLSNTSLALHCLALLCLVLPCLA